MYACGYGCPLLFFVGVDDMNRSCILGQGLLRSECTDTFESFLRQYEAAAGGRKPKVTVPRRMACMGEYPSWAPNMKETQQYVIPGMPY